MWLSNTSTTAMVMPIAEAVLQQLICTGLADSIEHPDSTDGSEDGTEDDCGMWALTEERVTAPSAFQEILIYKLN